MTIRRKTDLELLEILKSELKRLDMIGNPSRTEVQKIYNKEIMPHPNTYVNRFGSWQKALQMIGIDYDGVKYSSESSRKHITGKRYASTWSNMGKEEIIDAALSEVHHKNIKNAIAYQELRDKEKSPSLATLTSLTGVKWSDLRRMYRERFDTGADEAFSPNAHWSDLNDDELINIVTSEIKRINSKRCADYIEKRNRERTPSVPTLAKRGISWKMVTKTYEREKKND